MKSRYLWFGLLLVLVLAGCGAPAADPAAADHDLAGPQLAEAEPAGRSSDPAPSAEAQVGSGAYEIVAAESEARFIINEVLAGEDNTVVGVTSLVEGSIELELERPGQVEVGEIRVDVTGLTTDNNRRNGAIQNFILQTGQRENRAATFQISSIEGLPDYAEIGSIYRLILSGELTVHGVTQPEQFTGEVTVESAERLSGFFSTTVLYADYGMVIPTVPLVASVDDEVVLELQFTAERH